MMWLWAFGTALAVGILGASVTSEEWVFWLLAPGGFGVGLLIGIAQRTARLEKEIALLKRRLETLQADEATLPTPPSEFPGTTDMSQPKSPPQEETLTGPSESPPSPALATDHSSLPRPSAGAHLNEPDPWLATPSAKTPPNPALEALVKHATTFFTGDNAVVRVGVLVLFFGVAFLYRYGVERRVIRVEWNFILVTLAALAALAWGWRLRRRRPGFALLVQGGSVGVLYLTVFAAARLYPLIPLPLAFALMVALVALSTALALLQDAKPLALAGTVGGFLAPILASSGAGSHVMLLSYYALLNAGILTIAWFRSWRELNLAGFLFTLVIGGLWGQQYYQAEYFSTTEPFLVLFFLMFSAAGVLYALRQPPERLGHIDSTLTFGNPLAAFTLQWQLVRELEFGAAVSALALALYYLLLARWLWRQAKATPGLRPLTEAFVALAMVFATLAVPLALSGRWTSVVWVLEGAALVWVGARQHRRLTTATGLLLQLLAGFAFFLGDLRLVAGHWRMLSPTTATPAPDTTWLGAALIGVAGLFSGWMLQRRRNFLWAWTRPVIWMALPWGELWWLFAGLDGIDNLAASPHRPALSLLWLSLNLATFRWLGRKIAWPGLMYSHLALLPVLLLAALPLLIPVSHPFAHLGWLAWPVAFALWYHGLRQLEQAGLKPNPNLHNPGLWLLLALAAKELSWQTAHFLPTGDWSQLGWGIVPILTLWMLGVRRLGQGWPFETVPQSYRYPGPLLAAAWLWLWVILTAFANPGDAHPLLWLPLINPLEMTQLTGLLVLILWWLQYRAQITAWMPDRIARAFHAASGFLWANTVLARAVHHFGGVGFNWPRLLHSELYQTALSVFWGVLALVVMVTGSRLASRPFWLTGLGLYGLTVAKLFLVDLASQGTLERIVSFLVVGGLLVVTGYFAPRPSGRPEDTE